MTPTEPEPVVVELPLPATAAYVPVPASVTLEVPLRCNVSLFPPCNVLLLPLTVALVPSPSQLTLLTMPVAIVRFEPPPMWVLLDEPSKITVDPVPTVSVSLLPFTCSQLE